MSGALHAAEFRDPVHGYIYANRLERDVIDTPTFQRLRRIRQLAGAHLTYPGAQHSRFEHSIGCLHLAGLAARVLMSKGYIDEDEAQGLRLAALLHDVGHGPFSHIFEEVLASLKKAVSHEDMSIRIIRGTELWDALSWHGWGKEELPQLAVGSSRGAKRFLNDVIGGGLSVDVMDYLLRDSHFTGVEYGKVDVHRIINSYEVAKDRLAIEQAALYAFEALMLARYEMFRAVYFHRSVRSAELLLIRSMVLADGALHLSDLSDLERYLSLTDEVLLHQLTRLDDEGRSELKRARELALAYRDRRLLKCVFERLMLRKDPLLERILGQERIKEELGQEIAKEAGLDPDYIYVDVPMAPSVPLTSEKERLEFIDLVSRGGRGVREERIRLEDLPLTAAIGGYMNILRVYTTQNHRERVERAVDRVLGGVGAKGG